MKLERNFLGDRLSNKKANKACNDSTRGSQEASFQRTGGGVEGAIRPDGCDSHTLMQGRFLLDT